MGRQSELRTMGHPDGKQSKFTNCPWKLSLFSTRPIKRVQEYVADKVSDSLEDSTDIGTFGLWQDTSLSYKSAVIRMEVSRKGSDISRKNIPSGYGLSEVNPVSQNILDATEETIRTKEETREEIRF